MLKWIIGSWEGLLLRVIGPWFHRMRRNGDDLTLISHRIDCRESVEHGLAGTGDDDRTTHIRQVGKPLFHHGYRHRRIEIVWVITVFRQELIFQMARGNDGCVGFYPEGLLVFAGLLS